jgi:hypothetical protein
MWKIARWTQGGCPDGVVPVLKQPNSSEAKTIHKKAECLRGVLFPKPPEANLNNIGCFYPKPIKFPPITTREVEEAIHQAPPEKALGPDGIPNHVWYKLANVPGFAETIQGIFKACVQVGHNAQHFQESVMVVLWKGGP